MSKRAILAPALLWSVAGFLLSLSGAGCAEKKEVVKPEPVVKQVAREKTPEEFYNDGVSALQAKNDEQALAAFQQALSKSKDAAKLVDAHFNTGVVFLRRQDFAGAQRAFEETLKLEPKHRDALLNLGVVYKQQQKFPEAIDLYKKALQAVPRDPLIMNNLIVLYRLNKQYKDAEKTGHRLLARAPTNVEAYKNMTLVYFDQGKWELAELCAINAGKMIEQQRKADPNVKEDPGLHNNLGMIYIKMGRFRDAMVQFEKALAINPNYTEALINIGAGAHRFRDYTRAISAYEKVLQIDPKEEKALRGLAYAYYGSGNSQKAIEHLSKVLDRRPNDTKTVFVLGIIHDSFLHDYGNAVKFYEKYKQLVGAGLQASDPVHQRLEAAKARLEMAAQVKADEEKARREEEAKRKALEASSKAEGTKPGEDKLKELLKDEGQPGGEQPPAPPPGDGKTPPTETKPGETPPKDGAKKPEEKPKEGGADAAKPEEKPKEGAAKPEEKPKEGGAAAPAKPEEKPKDGGEAAPAKPEEKPKDGGAEAGTGEKKTSP